MQVAVLGPLEVRDASGAPIEVNGARVRALLARLALNPGTPVASDALVDAVWGEAAPADAANALQSIVSRLRRALAAPGDGGVVVFSAGSYRLAVAPDDVDATSFERLAGEGRRALRVGEPARAAEQLTRGLDLWRGPALEDIDAAFAAAHGARLEELRLAATEDRIEAELALGHHADVLADVSALSAANPLRERARGQLLMALCGVGRQADALAAYEETRRALADQLGIDPSAELQALHLAILRGELSTPTAASEPFPAAARTNLRAQTSSFVGRAENVERIRRLLRDARLVTLVGTGGAGKTRLAAEVAAGLAEELPDGAWLVELAPVREAADLPRTVLAAFGAGMPVPIGMAEDSLQRLVASLRTKRLLLVLDNCEHLVDAVAQLADLFLGSCPDVRLLATSREPLAITGETLCPVPPLALPAAGATPEEAMRSPAVQLLVERARAVLPGFAVEDGNVAAIVQLCRRLDGLPLAIELAAPRLRAMSPADLVARLDDRFRLLTGGSRTAQSRHQTLRAVVQWSWDLLEEHERVVARRLSVFADGATLDAAERVCAIGTADGGSGASSLGTRQFGVEVASALVALVDKSLVEPPVDGRYRMLETVRSYAAERLSEAGEAEAVRAAHAAWYLELAEEADPRIRGREQLEWLARLDAEYDDLVAAFGWAVSAVETETAVRLGAALGWAWTLRGESAETATRLTDALALPGEAPALARAQAQLYLGLNSFARDDAEEARKVLLSAREASQQVGAAHPVLVLAEPLTAMLLEDWDAAEAATRAVDHPDAWARATARVLRSVILLNRGDALEGEREALTALDAFRDLGDRFGVSACLTTLADLRSRRGDNAGAIAALEEALALANEIGAKADSVEVRAKLAMQRLRANDQEGARTDLERARRAQLPGGPDDQSIWIETGLAEMSRSDGDLTAARNHLRHALGLVEAHRGWPQQIRGMVLASLARVTLELGDAQSSAELYVEASAPALASGDMPVAAELAEGVAQWMLHAGDAERAAGLLGAAEVLRGVPDMGSREVADVSTGARSTLGPAAYERLYKRAAAGSRDDALAAVGAAVAMLSEASGAAGPLPDATRA